MRFPKQEYCSGLPFPSPRDLPNPGIEPCLLHCRQILYHLSHKGSPTTSSVFIQSLSCIWFFVTPWTIASQTSLSFNISWSLLKLMSIESVMLFNHLILSHWPLLLLPSVFPRIRVISKESALHIRWPKYWSFSFSISPSNEYSGWISFRIDLHVDFFFQLIHAAVYMVWGWINPPIWSHRYQWLTVKLYMDFRLHGVSTPHPYVAQRSATLALYYSYNRSSQLVT